MNYKMEVGTYTYYMLVLKRIEIYEPVRKTKKWNSTTNIYVAKVRKARYRWITELFYLTFWGDIHAIDFRIAPSKHISFYLGNLQQSQCTKSTVF